MDPVDGAADDAVLVFGPVGVLEQMVGRLIECDALADATAVLPDADNPVRGSCVLRMANQDGGRGLGYGSGRRAAPTGFFVALAGLLRRPDPDVARRRQGEPGRHRAHPRG